MNDMLYIMNGRTSHGVVDVYKEFLPTPEGELWRYRLYYLKGSKKVYIGHDDLLNLYV